MKRQTKDSLLKVLRVIALTAIVLFAVNYIGWVCRPSHTGEAIASIEAFHSVKQDTVDVLILGSSHAWKNVDTPEMYREYGIAAYNYGCNWQHINTTQLFLEDALRTQKPKVVCIETYGACEVWADKDMDGEVYYTREIPFSSAKIKYLKQCFGKNLERWGSYLFPIIMFHNNRNDIRKSSFTKSNTDKWIASTGFNGSDKVKEIETQEYVKPSQVPLSASGKTILDEMVALCKAKDIEVIFFTCPYFSGSYPYNDALAEYADNNDCVYLDLFADYKNTGISTLTDFSDAGHLNSNGANKVAHYLGEYISKHYELPDMRFEADSYWKKTFEHNTKE